MRNFIFSSFCRSWQFGSELFEWYWTNNYYPHQCTPYVTNAKCFYFIFAILIVYFIYRLSELNAGHRIIANKCCTIALRINNADTRRPRVYAQTITLITVLLTHKYLYYVYHSRYKHCKQHL